MGHYLDRVVGDCVVVLHCGNVLVYTMANGAVATRRGHGVYEHVYCGFCVALLVGAEPVGLLGANHHVDRFSDVCSVLRATGRARPAHKAVHLSLLENLPVDSDHAGFQVDA